MLLMLLILIPSGWLAIVAFFVILCQAAARGDAAMMASATASRPSRRATRRGLRVLDDAHAFASRGRGGSPTTATAGLTMRPPAASRVTRSRRPRCFD
jgi:hypothetical protein